MLQVTVNRIDGYLQSRIAFYLMNLHLTPRSIFFTRVRSRSLLSRMVPLIDLLHRSMANRSTTSKARSEGMPTSRYKGKSTCRLSPSSSTT